MTIYFTADLHLGHTDILAFAQRPWPTIEEHDHPISFEEIDHFVQSRLP